jgi:hypothetical protein
MVKTMEKRRVSFNGCNTGMLCPVKSVFCQEGWCSNCQVFLGETPTFSALRRDANQGLFSTGQRKAAGDIE